MLPVAEAEILSRIGDDDILRAPARDIVTLVPNGHYDFASGSSLATAQITGVVALLLARNQKLGVDTPARTADAVHRESRHHARAVSLGQRLRGAGAAGARRDLRRSDMIISATGAGFGAFFSKMRSTRNFSAAAKIISVSTRSLSLIDDA